MTIRELKARLARRPFEPFRVVTSSGQTYDVRHPENAILIRGGLVVAYGERNGGLPDVSATLSLLHITSIESVRNGRSGGLHRRKRRR